MDVSAIITTRAYVFSAPLSTLISRFYPCRIVRSNFLWNRQCLSSPKVTELSDSSEKFCTCLLINWRRNPNLLGSPSPVTVSREPRGSAGQELQLDRELGPDRKRWSLVGSKSNSPFNHELVSTHAVQRAGLRNGVGCVGGDLLQPVTPNEPPSPPPMTPLLILLWQPKVSVTTDGYEACATHKECELTPGRRKQQRSPPPQGRWMLWQGWGWGAERVNPAWAIEPGLVSKKQKWNEKQGEEGERKNKDWKKKMWKEWRKEGGKKGQKKKKFLYVSTW